MAYYKRLMAELDAGQRPCMFPDDPEPDENGLVCTGGDLSASSIIEAYTKGCFPWTGSHPVPWFSPDPRLVLFPEQFKTSRRLRRLARQQRFLICFDCNFRAVVENCAAVSRKRQNGTWITENMVSAYCELNELHIAHSVEVYEIGMYEKKQLCGGLYGLTFGRAFFGESMFSLESNTSKLALYVLCKVLAEKKFDFIDCQQVTPHLMRLGGTAIPRSEYLALLQKTLYYDSYHESWQRYYKQKKSSDP